MNKIAIGIFCFGEEYYFKKTLEKIPHILNCGISCYILTDNINYFSGLDVTTILYDRTIKSYHDKLILSKHILSDFDVCILIDADIHISDYSFLDDLKTFNYKEGISYPFTLKEHKSGLEYVKDLNLRSNEWIQYSIFSEKILSNFKDNKTIWENFIVINKNGFNNDFYKIYELLQSVKESIDIKMNKEIKGCGEGISIMTSSKVSNIPIGQDLNLYNLLKNKITDVSRRFTPKNLWPDFIK